MSKHGMISAGHPQTADAGRQILEAGGNAFDAAVAAVLAACFTEPLLASMAGGGFMLAKTPHQARLFDFFCQTPQQRNNQSDLYPIEGNFGATTQEFHIGAGAIATPGLPAGIHAIHQSLCTLPLHELAQPALAFAAQGIEVNRFQEYVGQVLAPIVQATPAARALFCDDRGQPLSRGAVQHNMSLRSLITELVERPPDWFYQAEPAQALVELCRSEGGHLTAKDLQAYGVAEREPLSVSLAGCQLLTNPVPSCGGALIAFGVKLLERYLNPGLKPGSAEHAQALVESITAMNQARSGSRIHLQPTRERCNELLSTFVEDALAGMQDRLVTGRGTTHISVADHHGHLCALTLTNGEGCGHVLPGTGIMLNNMLGEEDVNPYGLNRWPENRRISSMMAPTALLQPDGSGLALGTGGSNRIRTALIQVITGVTLLGMDVEAAVSMPRIHLEDKRLNIEPGWSASALQRLTEQFADHHLWDSQNLYFGGVHVAGHSRHQGWIGFGDPRRGGVCKSG